MIQSDEICEIGRVPNDPQRPDLDLARELALGFWATLPYIDPVLIATLLARGAASAIRGSARHLSTRSRRIASALGRVACSYDGGQVIPA